MTATDREVCTIQVLCQHFTSKRRGKSSLAGPKISAFSAMSGRLRHESDSGVFPHTGRSLGQMMSSSSVSMSRLRQRWLILDRMHAGVSASIVVRAFLLLRSREEA